MFIKGKFVNKYSKRFQKNNVKLMNLTATGLRDWVACIQLPDGCRIDSLWERTFRFLRVSYV